MRGSLRVGTRSPRSALAASDLMTTQDYVAALGALTGGQAVQKFGPACSVYLSGWQVAADETRRADLSDQSLYPANSVRGGS